MSVAPPQSLKNCASVECPPPPRAAAPLLLGTPAPSAFGTSRLVTSLLPCCAPLSSRASSVLQPLLLLIMTWRACSRRRVCSSRHGCVAYRRRTVIRIPSLIANHQRGTVTERVTATQAADRAVSQRPIDLCTVAMAPPCSAQELHRHNKCPFGHQSIGVHPFPGAHLSRSGLASCTRKGPRTDTCAGAKQALRKHAHVCVVSPVAKHIALRTMAARAVAP